MKTRPVLLILFIVYSCYDFSVQPSTDESLEGDSRDAFSDKINNEISVDGSIDSTMGSFNMAEGSVGAKTDGAFDSGRQVGDEDTSSAAGRVTVNDNGGAGGSEAPIGSGGTNDAGNASGTGGSRAPIGSGGTNDVDNASGSGGTRKVDPVGGSGGTRDEPNCACSTNDACCDGCLAKNELGSCSNDGIDCTDDICRAGECVHELKSGFCQINGICYADSEDNPENECQICDTTFTTSGWRNKVSGTSCDDGIYCNGSETCNASGTCANHTGDPCASIDSCRYCDENSNKCVYSTTMIWYDSTSGLSWEVAPSGGNGWDSAVQTCNALTLCGHSDWRVPSISELRTLIRNCAPTQTGGSCGVVDSCLDVSCVTQGCGNHDCTIYNGGDEGCHWPDAIGGDCATLWSSSYSDDEPEIAWAVIFSSGTVLGFYKTNTGLRSRCVRSGRSL